MGLDGLPCHVVFDTEIKSMISLKSIRGVAVTLATLGTMIPAAPVIAGEAGAPTGPVIKKVDAKVFDIKLSSGGTFNGRVVDHTGAPLEGAAVVIKQANKEVGQTLTDKTGSFAVSNLKTGVYSVASGNTEGVYRVWSETTAPPSAKEQGLLVMGENGARGNFGAGDGTFWVLGIGVVAFTALGIGIAALVRADQVANRTPASP
jgi:hypothetical protein